MTGTIPQQIAALQNMTVAQLVPEYERLHGRPPHCRNKVWLFKRCAWQLQANVHGGLAPEAQARLEELIAEIRLPEPGESRQRRKDGLQPGTTLTRTWHDKQISVRVTADAIEWDGKPYGSLSAVAKAVTGQHWSGHLFFGLRTRGRTR